MLWAILIICIVSLLGILALLGMCTLMMKAFDTQLQLAKEMHEADMEIIVAMDRIEDRLGTIRPLEKER